MNMIKTIKKLNRRRNRESIKDRYIRELASRYIEIDEAPNESKAVLFLRLEGTKIDIQTHDLNLLEIQLSAYKVWQVCRDYVTAHELKHTSFDKWHVSTLEKEFDKYPDLYGFLPEDIGNCIRLTWADQGENLIFNRGENLSMRGGLLK